MVSPPISYKVRRASDFERRGRPWRRWAVEQVVFDPMPPVFSPFRWLAVLIAWTYP